MSPSRTDIIDARGVRVTAPSLLLVDVAHLFWAAWLSRSEAGGFRAPIDIAATHVAEAAAGWPHVALAIDWPPYVRADPERGGSDRYKAHRTKDEAGREALRQLLRQLDGDGYRLVGVRGHEADDVCATLAHLCARRAIPVTIITGDKDLHVLLDVPCVHIIDVRSGTEVTAEAVRERWGVGPEQLGDLLAIAGDTSDGIPGVTGIGAKKAAELLVSRGSLAAVLAEVPLTAAELIAERDALATRRRAVAAARKKKGAGPVDVDTECEFAADGARVALLARVARIHEPEQRALVELSARLVRMREDLEIDLGALVAQRGGDDGNEDVQEVVLGGDAGPARAVEGQQTARVRVAPRAEAEPVVPPPPVASLAPEPEAGVTGSGAADGPCMQPRCDVAHLVSEPCAVAEERVLAERLAALAADYRAPADHDTAVSITRSDGQRESAHTDGADRMPLIFERTGFTASAATPSPTPTLETPMPDAPVAPPRFPPAVRPPPPVLAARPVARPAAAAASPRRGNLRLADATAGLVREAYSILIYGFEGVGKTSFAAFAPRTFIIGAENGSAEIGSVKRLAPSTFEDTLGLLEQLRTEAHDYQTVAIDSLDWFEPMVHAATCARGNKPTIEAFGFGKGYKEADTEWRMVIAALDAVRAKGIHVILCAHAQTKAFKNPDASQADYDRHTLKLHDRHSALLKEWAKVVLFASFERTTVESNNRHKGLDTGRRIVGTRMTAAYDAKNRLWLPAEITLGWGPFERAVEAGRMLRERYYAAIAKADDATRASAQEHIESTNYDPAAIEEVIAGLTTQEQRS